MKESRDIIFPVITVVKFTLPSCYDVAHSYTCTYFEFRCLHVRSCSSDLLASRAVISIAVVFLSCCNIPAQGRVAIGIRKYGFLFPPVEEEEWCCLGQPSTHQALISHLDVIYCGLHRENSVYCNRDHNYHWSALS